jgi:hypothetical protein
MSGVVVSLKNSSSTGARAGELVSANALVGLNKNLGRLVGGPLGLALLLLSTTTAIMSRSSS